MSRRREGQWGEVEFTKHAARRCQQRGIRQEAIYVVAKYGKPRYSNGGVTIAMDKAARREAKKEMGGREFKRVAENLGIYVILSLDMGTVLTVAHILRRFRSP